MSDRRDEQDGGVRERRWRGQPPAKQGDPASVPDPDVKGPGQGDPAEGPEGVPGGVPAQR
jgi:hypothetical protein